MARLIFPALSVLGLAAVLWVVPSIGTQGMGTIGQRFSHADRTLVEAQVPTPADPARTAAALRRADAQVEAALAR